MQKRIALFLLVLSMSLLPFKYAFGHCQIPCGIYDDQARFAMISEHIATIEKSINEINHLSKDAEKNYNQIVRWVNNKEYHADKIMQIVTQYFMAQRVKSTEATKISLLHKMLVYAMKCKQTVDIVNARELSFILEQFQSAYFGPAAEAVSAATKKEGKNGQ
ncbi:superoxide dismutase [Ni] [Candidatus Omnitrophota bacterium]